MHWVFIVLLAMSVLRDFLLEFSDDSMGEGEIILEENGGIVDCFEVTTLLEELSKSSSLLSELSVSISISNCRQVSSSSL